MYRRAYALLVGNALLMGGLAIIAAIFVGKRLADPEGSFLGPSWLRLPLLLTGALLLDMLPRVIWYSKGRPSTIRLDRPGAAAHPLDQGAPHPGGPRHRAASTSSTSATAT